MKVQIADEALTPLEPHVSAQRTMDQLVQQAVGRVGHVGPNERHLVLTEADLNQLEDRLRCIPLAKPADLHRAVNTLADVSLGGISFQFTAGQLEELKARAAREDQPVEEYVRRIIYAMIPMFFQTAPAQASAPELHAKRRK